MTENITKEKLERFSILKLESYPHIANSLAQDFGLNKKRIHDGWYCVFEFKGHRNKKRLLKDINKLFKK